MADEACGVALGEQHNWRQAQAMPSLPLGATTLPLGNEELNLQTTEPSYCRREKRVYQGPRKDSDLTQGARAEETPTQRPHALSNSAKQYLRLYSREYSSFRRFLLPPLLCGLMNEPPGGPEREGTSPRSHSTGPRDKWGSASNSPSPPYTPIPSPSAASSKPS